MKELLKRQIDEKRKAMQYEAANVLVKMLIAIR
jgi:hypothetical protein